MSYAAPIGTKFFLIDWFLYDMSSYKPNGLYICGGYPLTVIMSKLKISKYFYQKSCVGDCYKENIFKSGEQSLKLI